MRILLINHDGGGYADHVEVPEGTTVQKLFDETVRAAARTIT